MATRQKVEDVFYTQEQVEEMKRLHALQTMQPDEPAELSPEERIQATLRDIQEDARAMVKLYHRGVGNKISWCADYAVAEFDANGFESIRREWGAGAYQIRLIGSTGVKSKVDIDIKERAPTALHANPQPAQNSELTAILSRLAEQNQTMISALTERAPAPDPMAQMQQMLQMMVLMREATGAGQQAPKSSIAEIVEAIKELKGVSAELNGEGPKEETLMSLAPQVLSLVQQGLQQRAAPAGDAVPPIQLPASIEYAQNPDTAQTEQPMQAPQQIDTEDPEMLEKLLIVSYLNKLVKMAAQNAPIEPAVDIVIDKLPDDMIDLLELDNWFDLFAGNFPAVAPHREWFTKVRTQVLAEVSEDPDAAAPAAGLTD